MLVKKGINKNKPNRIFIRSNKSTTNQCTIDDNYIANHEKNSTLFREYIELSHQEEILNQSIHEKNEEFSELRTQIQLIKKSKSWKIAAPLRKCIDILLLKKSSKNKLGKQIEFVPGIHKKNPDAIVNAQRLLAGRIPEDYIFIKNHIACAFEKNNNFSNQNCVIIAHYSETGQIAPYVIETAKHYFELGFHVVLTSDGSQQRIDIISNQAKKYFDAIIFRTCSGYDFTSIKAAFEFYPSLYESDNLIITNDSIIGPFGSLEPVLTTMSKVSCDYWGITESWEIQPHLQSFFLYCKRNVIAHPAFKSFFEHIGTSKERQETIYRYELAFSLWLESNGFTAGAYIPATYLQTPYNSPINKEWQKICFEFKFPFIKKRILNELCCHERLALQTQWADEKLSAYFFSQSLLKKDSILVDDLANADWFEKLPFLHSKKKHEVKALDLQLQSYNTKVHNLQNELRALYASYSWRCTYILRKGLDFIEHAQSKHGVLRQNTSTEVLQVARMPAVAWVSSSLEHIVSRADAVMFHIPYKVDIIIPIFNGKKHLEALLPSLFKNTPEPHRFIFIDDASTDVSLLPWLQNTLADRSDCLLIKNPINLGFPATVNKGASLATNNFVILNSDVMVPMGWLSRLLAPLEKNPAIASVTPFSNSATIFSFPEVHVGMHENMEFLTPFQLAEIDAAFHNLDPKDIDLCAPTAVGFCMGISIKAWYDGFGFSPYKFGIGYGEENYWCMNTARKGWKHHLVPNLFVMHHHTGSFGSEKRNKQIALANQILKAEFPEYFESVRNFVQENKWEKLRLAALLNLFTNNATSTQIILSHPHGGGATHYIARRIAQDSKAGICTFLIIYIPSTKHFTLEISLRSKIVKIENFHIERLHDTFFKNFNKIIVNNLVKWPQNSKGALTILNSLKQLKKDTGCKLEILFHDFFAICPSINLLDNSYTYCHPTKKIKNCTILCQRSNMFYWRSSWQDLLLLADEIVFFSQSSLEIVKTVYTMKQEAINVLPHSLHINFNSSFRIQNKIKIGIVGALLIHKGAAIVERLAEFLYTSSANVEIIIIGAYHNARFPNMTVHGVYQKDELEELLQKYQISVCLFPSICPETFSYVTHELIAYKMPLVCFNLGAQTEAVGKYERGLVLDSFEPKDIFVALEQLHQRFN